MGGVLSAPKIEYPDKHQPIWVREEIQRESEQANRRWLARGSNLHKPNKTREHRMSYGVCVCVSFFGIGTPKMALVFFVVAHQSHKTSVTGCPQQRHTHTHTNLIQVNIRTIVSKLRKLPQWADTLWYPKSKTQTTYAPVDSRILHLVNLAGFHLYSWYGSKQCCFLQTPQ